MLDPQIRNYLRKYMTDFANEMECIEVDPDADIDTFEKTFLSTNLLVGINLKHSKCKEW